MAPEDEEEEEEEEEAWASARRGRREGCVALVAVVVGVEGEAVFLSF